MPVQAVQACCENIYFKLTEGPNCVTPLFLPKLDAAVWVGSRYWRRGMAEGLLEAVRGLRLAYPALGPKPLLAKG